MSNDFHERLGDLEVNFSVVNEKLGHTSDILGRMQNTMEQQTQLLSKVLVIQERQETFKEGLGKAVESTVSLDTRVSALEKVQTYVGGWAKGIAVVLAGLLVVLTFSVKQNIARVDKIEADIYKPTMQIVQK